MKSKQQLRGAVKSKQSGDGAGTGSCNRGKDCGCDEQSSIWLLVSFI